MTTIADPSGADTRSAVAELRRARQRRRLGDTAWGDLAYRVYTTAFFCLVVAIMLSGWVGDTAVQASDVRAVAEHGPAWAGLLVALVILAGVRSGARGGPIALEAADVQFLLLAPPDRTATLRRPTAGILGYGIATGVVVAGVCGSLFSQRLPGSGAEWVGAGALYGAVVAAALLGAALLRCSRRLPRGVAAAVAWGLLAWAVVDVSELLPDAPGAPSTLAGKLLFWPLEPAAVGLSWVALVVVLAGAGAALIGGLSIEAARRRTTLVGQLRFAVTQQDLRSVVLLRRQLASEVHRNRGWFPVPAIFARRFPVTARDLQSVSHWPPIRLVRVLVLVVGAGLATRGMWAGTTPLVLVAGLATFVAALDATEPLSQEVDHPTLAESMPLPAGLLLLRHLVEPCVVLLVAGCVSLAVAVAMDPAPDVLPIGAITLLTGALAAVAGAAVSTVSSIDTGSDNALSTPEIAGPRMVFRTAWPPLVAMIGFAPALAATRVDASGDPVAVALAVAVPVLALVAAVFGWVRFRDDIHRSMSESMSPGGS